MPALAESKNNINNINSQYVEKDKTSELNSLIGSLKNLKQNGTFESDTLKQLIKQILYTFATVSDPFFLTEVCEKAYELFVDFRMLLGCIEEDKHKDFEMIFEGIIKEFDELLSIYKKNMRLESKILFANPAKVKSMRELARMVKDRREDAIFLSQEAAKISHQSKADTLKEETADEIASTLATKALIEAIASAATLNTSHHLSPTLSISTDTDSSSVCSESNLLKKYESPSTPRLESSEISNTNPGLVEAMVSDLMSPPSLPSSRHGRIQYKSDSSGRCINFNGNLRRPVFIDEDGDILPTAMPELKSAAESIYESSNGKIIVDDD